jgi:hypothetical protein
MEEILHFSLKYIPTKIVYAFFISSLRAACPDHFLFLVIDNNAYEILGFHGGENVDCGRLGCDAT